MKNTEFKNYCLSNSMSSLEDRRVVMESAKLVLSILSKHKIPLNERAYDLVEYIRASTDSNIFIVDEERMLSRNSIAKLRAIEILPSLPVLVELKQLMDQVVDNWLSSFAKIQN